MCLIFSAALYETFLVLRITQLDTVINVRVHESSFKITLAFFQIVTEFEIDFLTEF
jgi:hypothetical protein